MTMSEITVKAMKRKDVDSAAAIHRRIIKEGLGQAMEYPIEKLFLTCIKSAPGLCLVAETDGAVAGFIVGSIKDWGFGVKRTGWIEIVGVSPEHMGKGIGKALGETLISHFRDKGIKEVHTSVRWDSGDLIEFFKSIGFDKSSFINLVYK